MDGEEVMGRWIERRMLVVFNVVLVVVNIVFEMQGCHIVCRMLQSFTVIFHAPYSIESVSRFRTAGPHLSHCVEQSIAVQTVPRELRIRHSILYRLGGAMA